MKKSKFGWAILIALLGVLFCYGVASTLRLRIDFGDAYAAYSTYRPDPMGAQAFYAALRRVSGLRVERHELPIHLLRGDESSAVLFLGVAETPDPPKSIEHLEEVVRAGGRLVLTYGMRGEETDYTLSEEQAQQLREDDETAEDQIRRFMKRENVPAISPPRNIDWGDGSTLVSERWGFRVVVPGQKELAEDPKSDDEQPARLRKVEDIPATALPGHALPESLVWKSKDYLLPLDERWEPLYTLPGDHVAMMQRHFGAGTIVIASDSFFVSNEAQRRAPQGAVLAFLLGGKSHVVFDESTKGVDRSPGIVALMKRFHLHIVMAVGVLLALLYAWRASVSLVPRRTQEEEQLRALLLQGRDANDGLASLLRRAVPPDRLLATCVAEWEQSHARTDPAARAKIAQAHRILGEKSSGGFPKNEAQFASDYMALAAVLHDRRTKR